MKVRRALAAAVSLALMLTWSGVAHAEELTDSSDKATIKAIENASETEGIDTSLNLNLTPAGKDLVASTNSGSIQISNNDGQLSVEGSSTALVIEDSDGHTLDTAGGEIATVESAGTSNVNYAVTVTDAGNVRVHSIIGDRNAPERYSYSFPGVDTIVLDEESGIALLFANVEGVPELVGGVDAPWARDANGVEVPTHFEAHGNTLVQVVEHKAGNFAYPITADPSWWDKTKEWFKHAGAWVAQKARSAAHALGSRAKWLSGKVWSGTKRVAGKGRVLARRSIPGALAYCAAHGWWRWYRSDAHGWVRLGDGVEGCFS